MSRIGKQPVVLESGVTATFAEGILSVKGQKGELKRKIDPSLEVVVSEKDINISLKPSKSNLSPIWGTFSSHVSNMVSGVSKGFEKKLNIEGIGYKVEAKGTDLVFALGFSHPVIVKIPEGLKATIEKNSIIISGIDKERVGSFAAEIRDYKKPEPYKGKGIRYDKEVVTIKQGKKSV